MGYRANLMILTLTDTYGRPLWQDGKIILPRLLVTTRDKFTKLYRGRFGLKKFQRGILQVAASTQLTPAGGPVSIAVTNIQIINSVSSGLCNAGIRFNESTVGSVSSLVKRHNAVFILMGDDDNTGGAVDHTGEWTTDGPAAADFEVGCTALVTGAWDVQHVGVGSFADFTTADMDWHENRPGGKGYTPGTDRADGTFRIREVADPGGNFDDFQVDASAIQT